TPSEKPRKPATALAAAAPTAPPIICAVGTAEEPSGRSASDRLVMIALDRKAQLIPKPAPVRVRAATTVHRPPYGRAQAAQISPAATPVAPSRIISLSRFCTPETASATMVQPAAMAVIT